jgi:hypothetical protein
MPPYLLVVSALALGALTWFYQRRRTRYPPGPSTIQFLWNLTTRPGFSAEDYLHESAQTYGQIFALYSFIFSDDLQVTFREFGYPGGVLLCSIAMMPPLIFSTEEAANSARDPSFLCLIGESSFNFNMC